MTEINQVFEKWNDKKIIVHKKLPSDFKSAIQTAIKNYGFEDVIDRIDFYATILENGIEEKDRIYYWTYRWTLYEFLKRGLKKFYGQSLEMYRRKQRMNSPQAVVFTRK